MSKKRALIILGFIIAVIPLTGFPRTLREGAIILSGLAVSGLAFLLHRRAPQTDTQKKEDTFSQNGFPSPKIVAPEESKNTGIDGTIAP